MKKKHVESDLSKCNNLIEEKRKMLELLENSGDYDESLINELYNKLHKEPSTSIISPINYKNEEINDNNFNVDIVSSNNTSKLQDGLDDISVNDSTHYQNFNSNLTNVYKKKRLSKGKSNY